MKESPRKLPLPTTPEYIEIVKNEVRDEGDIVEFEFQFAGPISDEKMKDFWEDSESTVRKTAGDKLYKKGWMSKDGMKPLVRVTATGQHTEDGKTWKFVYKKYPDVPSLTN